jgi:AcrR family transcriptional regulator
VPKDTFLNLPEAKRQAIIEAAVDEFAANSYEQASVNRIVAGAGIAKGSFYQYFEDKQDLFFYVMNLIGREKINFMSPVIANPAEHDIFTVIREMYLSGVQFAIAYPRYAAIGARLLADKDAPIYGELQAESRLTAQALFRPLISRAMARGEIRTDVDVDMLHAIIMAMNVSIVEYCSEKYPDTLLDAVAESVDAFMDLLKNGIGTQSVSSRLKAES